MTAEDFIKARFQVKDEKVVVNEKTVGISGKETITIEVSALAAQYRKLLEDATISDADKVKAINEILYPTPAKVEIQDISDPIIAKIKGT